LGVGLQPDSSSPVFGFSSVSTVLPGIDRSSDAQAPRSISLQRSLQNGRHGELSLHSTARPQVGHRMGLLTCRR
jgi:hypothetical protein